MSRTWGTKHLAPRKYAERGPKNQDRHLRSVRKSSKQRRANDRVKLRREYL